MISAEDVVDAVQNFLEDMSAEAPTSAQPSAGGKSADDDRIGQKRLHSMKNFWTQLSNVVSDESVEVWEQMEKNYSNLKELLIKRSKSIARGGQVQPAQCRIEEVVEYLPGRCLHQSWHASASSTSHESA